jgi:two-component system, NarL family, nitrate/nitrite response regulator NarL
VATIVLGDGHVVFLDALSTVLAQQGHVVRGVARGREELVRLVGMHQPEACLLDRGPGDDTVRGVAEVRAACGGTSVIVLGAGLGAGAAGLALDAGASGYVHQSRGLGALLSALERVLGGEIVVDVPDAQPSRPPAEPSQALRLAALLTSRERECLMMLVEGLDTAAIVDLLGVSRTTVRTHLQSVLTKLGVHSRLEAASFAVRHRLPERWSSEHPLGSTVRPIAPRRARHAGKRAVPAPPLPAAGGQSVSESA